MLPFRRWSLYLRTLGLHPECPDHIPFGKASQHFWLFDCDGSYDSSHMFTLSFASCLPTALVLAVQWFPHRFHFPPPRKRRYESLHTRKLLSSHGSADAAGRTAGSIPFLNHTLSSFLHGLNNPHKRLHIARRQQSLFRQTKYPKSSP